MIRKANITDIKEIQALISYWAKKGKLIERSLNYLYENLRDFWVYEEKGKIIGCCGFHVVGWQSLGEIKSLVVSKNSQKKGIGTKLVKKCVDEAAELKIKKLFTLTFVPKFFESIGFKKISMKKLPHKIWSDCTNCIYFPDCKETALIKTV
jgi:amino-acid N-acetyltransferase